MIQAAKLWVSRNVVPLVVFAVLFLQGASLGLTDDEAYYWVLAQRPALGYAFHPPMIAWVIALFQKSLGFLFRSDPAALVRLPAVLIIALSLAIGIHWIAEVTRADGNRKHLSGWTLAAYAGLVGGSWMMVPDLPLTLGWMVLFVSTWKWCFGEERSATLAWLVAGAAFAMLSKFSAVLAIGSAGLAVLIFTRGERRVRGVAAIALGTILALIPILIWNDQHGWGALIYQFRERHENSHFSGIRFGRFAASQLVIAGPLLFYSLAGLFRIDEAKKDRARAFVLLWAWPAALVFCVQPLFSEFKPHWAIVVWMPFALDLARRVATGKSRRWGMAQRIYGTTLIALVLLMCQFPLTTALIRSFSHTEPDPRWDVSNDMFGWSELKGFVDRLPERYRGLPVTASRYQTASQAAFALGEPSRVELVPRDLKQRDEWPDLHTYAWDDRIGATLKRPVLFVSDIRYNAPPSYVGAKCEKLGRIEKKRFNELSKWIDVWFCAPAAQPPSVRT